MVIWYYETTVKDHRYSEEVRNSIMWLGVMAGVTLTYANLRDAIAWTFWGLSKRAVGFDLNQNLDMADATYNRINAMII